MMRSPWKKRRWEDEIRVLEFGLQNKFVCFPVKTNGVACLHVFPEQRLIYCV